MNDVLLVLILFAAACAMLLIVGWLDERLDDRYPSYSDRWARAFGEPPTQTSHVRAVAVLPCRACDQVSWHNPGCSRLDQLDAGEIRP